MLITCLKYFLSYKLDLLFWSRSAIYAKTFIEMMIFQVPFEPNMKVNGFMSILSRISCLPFIAVQYEVVHDLFSFWGNMGQDGVIPSLYEILNK